MGNDTAMTGEISLRGLVLPVGGIKEKVAAAARAGLTRVMLPGRNRKDIEEISPDVRKRLELVWIDHADQAISLALAGEHTLIAAPPPDNAKAA